MFFDSIALGDELKQNIRIQSELKAVTNLGKTGLKYRLN